ncbi:hypothetical protein RIF23_18700 [Lipingzhangella sp. LS1_29]|uniref:Uncharacterized protein n=1 Tax=Lipingzhangella rawalii TaxID=2055835 RepID=A0ABU2HAH2_9ACTN|nr:hypothetical protein [Lipingzhangella rawalii]MDS1272321.1 hypothetical protein [Lipingzhangella rawalii]
MLPPSGIRWPAGIRQGRCAPCRRCPGLRAPVLRPGWSRQNAALGAGADPGLVTEGIKESQAQGSAAQDTLDRSDQPTRRMGKDDITTIVNALGNTADVLHAADPADKAEVYTELGLRLRYQPVERTVRAEGNLNSHDMYKGSCPRGTRTKTLQSPGRLTLSTSFALEGR